MEASGEGALPPRERGLEEALRLYSEGEFDRALAVLDGVVAAAPGAADLAPAHCLRGLILEDSNRAAEAVEAFDRALAADPTLERAWFHRGTARFLAGDREGAVADLERAVEAEPGFVFAHFNLGVAAAGKRDWERAKRAFARCLDLDPANREEYVNILVEIGRGAAQEEVYAQGHRLKNLLGVVGEHFRSLEGALGRLPVPRELTEQAGKVGEELRSLYSDMVQFLRAVDREPPELDLIDMRELVETCLFALSARLRGIRVARAFAPWAPEVIGDRRSLAEAIRNILVNAVEACESRPEPSISVKVEPIDAIPAVPGIDSIEIEIRDTGPGIAPEHLPHVFEFGYTTKRFGSGLGLSYAQRVVRAHGGRIEIASKAGEGAVVTVILPASPIGAPDLRTLGPRSVLFEDLRGLLIRTARGVGDAKKTVIGEGSKVEFSAFDL
jgi:signal transduction histidine kinase